MTTKMEDIERDLSQSREQLKESVNALGEKFTLGQLIDDVLEKSGFDLSSAKNAASNAAKLTVPGAVLGAGIALLISNLGPMGKRHHNGSAHNGHDDDVPEEWQAHERYRSALSLEDGLERLPDEDDASYRRRLRPLQGKVLGYVRESGEDDHSFHDRVERGLRDAKAAIKKAGERVAGAGKSASKGIEGMANGAAGKVAGAATAVGDGLKSGLDRVQAVYADNPVLGVAAGVCIGALLGSLVPLTRKEQEILGKPVAKAAAAVAEAGERAAQDVGRGIRAAGAEHRAPDAGA